MTVEKVDRYNYGLAILRIWMCFEVILDHFMKWEVSSKYELNQPYRLLYEYGNVAVPVFMIMSFLLCDISGIALENGRAKRRLYRLLIPYAFWNCFYFILYAVLAFIKPGAVGNYGIKDFISQFLFGSVYNATLWFQVEIIVITILFLLIYKHLKKELANKVVLVMAIVSIAVQYTGLLARFYMIDHSSTILGRIFNPADYVFTIFRFFEVLPMAAIGVLLFQYGFIKEYNLKHRIIFIIALLFLLKFFRNTAFFVEPNGFGYGGARLIVIALLTVFVFLFLPTDFLPSLIKKSIKLLAGTTMATYYMHRLVEALVRVFCCGKCSWLKEGALEYCVLIFLCSTILAILCQCIPIKWIRESFR